MSTDTLSTVEQIMEPTPGQLLRRRIFRHRGLMIGASILALIMLMAVTAPLIAPLINRICSTG